MGLANSGCVWSAILVEDGVRDPSKKNPYGDGSELLRPTLFATASDRDLTCNFS